ncbi:MAG: helix-turn-helix domain-containing protein [Candidatus Woesearchaeota archaeon]
MLEILERSGLSKNEARVYIALLDSGLSSSKPIIKNTGLHRQLVYDALDSLIGKGLVSFVIQANRKHFKAADPKGFMDYFEKKQEEIDEQKQEFQNILPQLAARKEQSSEKQETTVYSGNKGIKSLIDDMLNQKSEILTIGASEIEAESFKYHLKFNLPKFHKFREQKKIPYKILFSEELRQRAKELNKLKHAQAKVLPKEFTTNSSTNIYGDKVSIIMWGSSPFGILIKSKEISGSQRKHFAILWEAAKKP